MLGLVNAQCLVRCRATAPLSRDIYPFPDPTLSNTFLVTALHSTLLPKTIPTVAQLLRRFYHSALRTGNLERNQKHAARDATPALNAVAAER